MTPSCDPTITLTDEGEWWVARDTETGIASQGRTRHTALKNLDEALAGFHGEGESPTEKELRETSIDPANNDTGRVAIPDIFEEADSLE